MAKIWCDITQVNNKYVAKDTFKAIAFLVGLLLLILSAIASLFQKVVPTEPALILITLSFGLQVQKSFDKYFNSKSESSTEDKPTEQTATEPV